MEKSNLLYLETRQNIYNLISHNPGLHLRKISRKLHMPLSTLEYHIRFLIKHKLISFSKKGRYQRFYTLEPSSYKYKKILDLLRKDTSRNVILLIMHNTVASRREISEELELHPNTVSNILKKLIDMEIIEQAPYEKGYCLFFLDDEGTEGRAKRKAKGREVFYRLTVSFCYFTYEALIVYRDSIFDDPSFKTILDEMKTNINNGIPKKLLDPISAVDKAIEAMYDVFPHPYHV
jgi:Mn-dependent DtxR family transcriptional regulator